MTARLTAYRLACDDGAFKQELNGLAELMNGRHRGKRYYTSKNIFTDETILFEQAEFARVHEHELDAAWHRYERIARSAYPIHAGLGHLGLGLIEAMRGEYPEHARTAARIGGEIGLRLVTARAHRLMASPSDGGAGEVFFC